MSKLWFDVRASNNLIVDVFFRGPTYEEKPEILLKLAELLRKNDKPVRVLAGDFPEDAEIIFALDHLLTQYKIISVNGIGWNCKDGHFIYIFISPSR